MKELNHCPSTLADGFSTYSPTACKKLFDGQKVSHLLDFEIDEISKTSETMIAMRRISVSGAQEKFPAVIENGIIRISQTDERSRYILKPAPWDNTLQTRKQIPANEHLTMQIASQVYGIITAENGLCFTPHGDMIYITKRFDIAWTEANISWRISLLWLVRMKPSKVLISNMMDASRILPVR